MTALLSILLAAYVVQAQDLTCNSVLAELKHRQLVEHNRTDPWPALFDSVFSIIHRPTLQVLRYPGTDRVTGFVRVGLGANQPVKDCPDRCIHPMDPSYDPATVHYITTVLITDDNNEVLAMAELSADEAIPASMTYEVHTKSKTITAWAYCQQHGLFIGDPGKGVMATEELIAMAPEAAVVASNNSCVVEKCLKNKDTNTTQSIVATLRNRQNQTFGQLDAWPIEDENPLNCLHRPVLKVDAQSGKGTVTVGLGPAYHPFVPSSDPTKVHYPDFIYVLDQDKKVVAMHQLSPTETTVPATFTFDLPNGVRTLTPYTHCNIHGLFQGSPMKSSWLAARPATVTCDLTPSLPHN